MKITEEYCKYCWANCEYKECIASNENRSLLCKKAKERMFRAKKKPKTSGESVKIKKYMIYIQKRINYLKHFRGKVLSNEQRYYMALQDAIREWGKSHIIFYACLYGKMETQQGKNMLGVSLREFYRIMSKQREVLIKFIEKQEQILSEKYPFEPMSDIFMEN